MRLGVHLPQFRRAVSAEDVRALARAAEEEGADDVWVSDHVILPAGSTRPPELFHDALTVLTLAAAATERVGLGTSVLVAPYRHPVLLARALASLDALSGGRVVCGIASGWHRDEFAALGVPFGERGRRTDDALDALRRLWTDPDSGPAGPATPWAGLRISPGPARPGGPPLWVGGDGDAGIRRAVRRGDAWHTTVADPSRLRERVEALRRECARCGRDPVTLPVSVRWRALPEQVAERVPAFTALGVGHLLVDPPAGERRTPRELVRAYRAAVPPG